MGPYGCSCSLDAGSGAAVFSSRLNLLSGEATAAAVPLSPTQFAVGAPRPALSRCSVGQGFVDFIADAGLTIQPLPYRSFLDAGVTVASGSDFPAPPSNPFLGLYALTSRRSREGDLIAEEETLTPLEALRTQTINAAVAMFRDHEVGSIEPGKRADLAILSNDPTLVDSHAVREISVQQTYIDGELKYSL